MDSSKSLAGWRAALALSVLCAPGAEALTYSWRPSVTAYAPVTGTPITFSQPDNGTVSLTLPFTFTYDSVSYTTLGASSNGLLVLGTTNTSTANANLFTSSSPFSALAPWWDDLIDDVTAAVDTFTQGTSPNRVFVVQYRDYPDYSSGASLRLNWQVRLHEGSNRIQFAYGSKNGAVPSSFSSASVGIKGRLNVPGFYIEGTSGSRTVPNSTLNSNAGFPASGTVFTFAPDTAAPQGLTAAPGPGRADLTWRPTRLPSIQRYRIWLGTSPTSMTPRDSTSGRTDTTLALTGLTNGTTYYIGVTVLGPGQEESGFAQVVAVTPTQLPTVAITSPASGSVHPSTGSITFTANASDPDGSIARVEYYRGVTLIGSSTAGTTFPVTWTPLVAGTHSITARAYDNLGGMATSSPITVIVNLLPTVSFTGPPSGTVVAPGSNVTLTATASDADGSVAQVEFLRDGVPLGTDATAPYAFTWTANPSGRYVLTARVTDDRGATSTSTSSILIVTTPPTVSVTSPSSGALVHSVGGLISLAANAVDADGTVSRVDYYRGATLVGGSTAGNPFAVNATAVSGIWTLTARATDNLGALDTSVAVTFTVNLPPSAGLTAPTAGAYALGTVFNLTASAADGDGSVTRVEFFYDGVRIGEDNSSPYSLPWTPDTAGRYALTVRATDNSGGTTTSTTTWVTLSRPPTVRFTQPLNDGFLRYPQDSLKATASDSDGTVARVEYYNGTTLLGSSTAGNPFGFRWSLPSRGTFQLIARAYDNVGLAGKPDTIVVSTDNVRLLTPAHFSAFATNSSISITASAFPPLANGSITRVDFYRDSILIGSSASGPTYGMTWSNAPAGRYRLQARARDNRDSVSYSQPVTIFVNDSARSVLGGRVFITGHDADVHNNVEFISAGLDFLLFGHAAKPFEIPFRKGARIALLANTPWVLTSPLIDYPSVTFINIGVSGWDTLAFDKTHYDALVVGTYSYYVNASGSAALAGKKSKFDTYFNNGGGVFAMSEYYHGQPYYDFLPSFGSATGQNIGQIKGRFRVTNAGETIGLDSSIVNRDLTHTEFLSLDSVFQIFEIFKDDGEAVTIGASAVIDGGGGYIPADSVVADPQAFSRDTVFVDTLCIRFESATPGAVLHLTRDGGNPDTSSWTIANGSSVCIDNSARFRVIAKRLGWVSSAEKEFGYRRADQVAVPIPDIPSGYFRDRVCVQFTSATPGASVVYTLDGGRPDTSTLSKPSGDSICLDASRVIRVLGRRTGMRDSDTASHAYFRMEKLAMPTLDRPDSTWFPDSLCFRFSAATPGSHIHYTLDGGDPDTAKTHVHDGDSLCVDRSVTVRLMASRMNFIPSDENSYRYFRMDRVAAPVSNRPDSTRFRDSLCLVLSTATPGAAIHYTLNGSLPDSSSPLAPAGGLCVDSTVRVQAIAVLRNWVNSPVSAFVYPKMEALARPAADPPDSTGFSGSLCVRFSTNAEGATLRYSLDGTAPAASPLIMPMSDSLCFDSTVTIRALAEKANWIPSPEAAFTYRLMPRVDRPTASRGDSSWFADTLCARFATATDSATLHYLLGPGRADTSSLTLPEGQDLCVDRDAVVRVAGTRPGWLPSEELVLRFFKMDTVAAPSADPGDSTWFAGRQCLRLSSSTPGAAIRYTRDGSDPALSGLDLAGGDTVCVEDTATVRALARKRDWVDSRESVFRYFPMQKVATPVADRPDSTYFADSLCVRFATTTPGAALRFTTGGSLPDTASPALPEGGALCVDRTAELRVIGTLDRWIPSDPLLVRALKMDTVARPIPEPGDSTYFPQSLCVRWSVPTPGAAIRVTLDGSRPDSSSRALAGGDTLCLDSTATVRALAMKPDWISSPDTAVTFLRMLRAARPTADQPDSLYFPDRLCIRYLSATEGVRIHYTLDGGQADTSSLSIANGDTLCVDRTVRIEAAAVRRNWIPSEALVRQVFRMERVAVPVAGVPDSTWFRDSLCVPWTIATAGAAITVRRAPLDTAGSSAGTGADSAGEVLASGDSVCLDRSATLRSVGSLKNWMDSPEAIRTYLRMDTVAIPVFDRRDTVFYPSVCVKVTMSTPGAAVRYTLDGGDPDTSSLVKPGSDTICTDRSARIRAVGEREHSVRSGEAALSLGRMAQVAPLQSSIGDSALYSRRICFTLSTATDSVRIRYTLDGGDPLDDTLSMAGGDTLCLERSAELVAVGTRPLWRNSPEIRVRLEIDNDGPRVVKAEKSPYDIVNIPVTGNCRGIGRDTLRVTFSEALFPKSRPPRWDRLLIFSPSCDSGEGLPVRPASDPVLSADGLEATILLDNYDATEKPKLGNCLSLDWRSGEFPDRVGNLPERHGVRIAGREGVPHISHLRAYPPVVGLENARPSASVCSDEGISDNTWIPPYGFDPARGVIDSREVRNCLESGGEPSGRSTAIPPCVSLVEVISDGQYIADVSIFDHLGNFVHGSRQQFGACGELDNLERSVAGKRRSYLVWNTRDNKGTRAGNGVYVWRIAFQSERKGTRQTQTVMVKTGLLRNGACAD